MLIKICGTTNLEDARQALAAGADALGFIFAPSKRRVSFAEVAAITRELPAEPLRVGVFTVPEAAEIVHTVREADLSAVQMHFAYDESLVAALAEAFAGRAELWQVVPVEIAATEPATAELELVARLKAVFSDPRLNAVLLDASVAGASGGLGVSFSWGRVRTLLDEALATADTGRQERMPKLILAGGLGPANVQEAVAALRPAGVDVVSGVEASPGRKDPDKVRMFVRNARAAADKLER